MRFISCCRTTFVSVLLVSIAAGQVSPSAASVESFKLSETKLTLTLPQGSGWVFKGSHVQAKDSSDFVDQFSTKLSNGSEVVLSTRSQPNNCKWLMDLVAGGRPASGAELWLPSSWFQDVQLNETSSESIACLDRLGAGTIEARVIGIPQRGPEKAKAISQVRALLESFASSSAVVTADNLLKSAQDRELLGSASSAPKRELTAEEKKVVAACKDRVLKSGNLTQYSSYFLLEMPNGSQHCTPRSVGKWKHYKNDHLFEWHEQGIIVLYQFTDANTPGFFPYLDLEGECKQLNSRNWGKDSVSAKGFRAYDSPRLAAWDAASASNNTNALVLCRRRPGHLATILKVVPDEAGSIEDALPFVEDLGYDIDRESPPTQ